MGKQKGKARTVKKTKQPRRAAPSSPAARVRPASGKSVDVCAHVEKCKEKAHAGGPFA